MVTKDLPISTRFSPSEILCKYTILRTHQLINNKWLNFTYGLLHVLIRIKLTTSLGTTFFVVSSSSVCGSSYLFWTTGRLWTYQPGSHGRKDHTGFLIHLALIFLARRIQPFLSLVDREVEFSISSRSFRLLNALIHPLPEWASDALLLLGDIFLFDTTVF